MKPDPILEELWAVKDALANEAGCNVDRFIENLRRWEAEHPSAGQVIRGAGDLRKLVEEEERKRSASQALSLNETPPDKFGVE